MNIRAYPDVHQEANRKFVPSSKTDSNEICAEGPVDLLEKNKSEQASPDSRGILNGNNPPYHKNIPYVKFLPSLRGLISRLLLWQMTLEPTKR